jgi:hypothetical protein
VFKKIIEVIGILLIIQGGFIFFLTVLSLLGGNLPSSLSDCKIVIISLLLAIVGAQLAPPPPS